MKILKLSHIIRSHPAVMLGVGLVFTLTTIITYNKIIRPAWKQRHYAASQAYAEYLFQAESKKTANESNS